MSKCNLFYESALNLHPSRFLVIQRLWVSHPGDVKSPGRHLEEVDVGRLSTSGVLIPYTGGSNTKSMNLGILRDEFTRLGRETRMCTQQEGYRLVFRVHALESESFTCPSSTYTPHVVDYTPVPQIGSITSPPTLTPPSCRICPVAVPGGQLYPNTFAYVTFRNLSKDRGRLPMKKVSVDDKDYVQLVKFSF